MKTSIVYHSARAGLILGAKKYSGAKNAVESFDDPPVMTAIFGKVKELEEFRGRLELYHPVLLADRQRRNPNWNEPVMAVRDGRFIMHLPQYRLGILCLFGVYLSCAPGFGVSVRLTPSA